MTNKEINGLLKKSKSFRFLDNLEITLNFDQINFTIEFKGFFELYTFVNRQQKGWDKITVEIPTILNKSKEFFKDFYNDLIDILKSDNIESEWKTLTHNFIDISIYNKYDDTIIFTFDSPLTSFLIELSKIDEDAFDGGYSYLFKNIDIRYFENKNFLIGFMKAYEFEQQAPEKLLKRSKYERSNLSRLRTDFESLLVKSNKRIIDLSNEIENLKKDKKKSFDSWFNKIKNKEDIRYNVAKKNDAEYSEYSLNRSKELEDLYSDKLMLSKPAEYWNKRAKELKKESRNWLISLLIATSVSVFILVFLIVKISNETLVNLFSNVGSAIRWSIILISLISFLAFAIRIFSKLSLSSYHLARDAEERKQLVYVYLSLKNQKGINDNERILILQSIFSRSDTGLLKEDSSPTMPSASIIEKIMTNK